MIQSNSELVVITRAVRAKLRAELTRTGVTPASFLKQSVCLNRAEIPPGFTHHTVASMLRGRTPQVCAHHLTFVFEKLAQIADGAGPVDKSGKPLLRRGRKGPAPGEQWIEVNADMITLIQNERERTGCDLESILASGDAPETLTLRIVQSWLYGDAKSADPRYWSFVVNRYAGMPDRVR